MLQCHFALLNTCIYYHVNIFSLSTQNNSTIILTCTRLVSTIIFSDDQDDIVFAIIEYSYFVNVSKWHYYSGSKNYYVDTII
jgi:hypothetical protein